MNTSPVQVPGVVTVVAVLVGGTLLGIIGALVAIPIAAALRLVLYEVKAVRRRACRACGGLGGN